VLLEVDIMGKANWPKGLSVHMVCSARAEMRIVVPIVGLLSTQTALVIAKRDHV
jgi:hypothetical protein